MNDPLSAAWDSVTQQAAEWDDEARVPGRTWVPPILTDLVRAARDSSLGRFHPFTSHASLRFGAGPEWWSRPDHVLPIAITLLREGRYLVSTRPSSDGPFTDVLETADAAEAVATAAALVDTIP